MVTHDDNLKLVNVMVPINQITGVILAGGQATRMGGQDKGLIPWQGKFLVESVITVIRPQVSTLFISANRNQSRYANLCHCLVLTDRFGDYAGPLAGIATALQQALTDYVLFVPCDSPQLSLQLVSRLYTSLLVNQAAISVADDGNRLHYVIALIKRDLLPDLLIFLNQGKHKVSQWYAQHTLARANFSDIPETLININTLEEYAILTGNYH